MGEPGGVWPIPARHAAVCQGIVVMAQLLADVEYSQPNTCW